MPVTLKDVASESGYSVTTVSRALGGYDDVNEQTRQHIQAVARRIGYQPNQIARQLQKQQTHTLGLIMPGRTHNSAEDLFSLLLKGITYTAAREGYDVLISAGDDTGLDAYRRIAGGNRVDGMIIARLSVNDTRITYLQNIKHPFIVYGRRAPGEPSDFPHIDVDGYAGMQTLTQHFIDLGHRHIGFLASPQEMTFTPYRLNGYRDVLQAAGLLFRESYVVHSALNRSAGRAAASTLLDRAPDISAIIACTDAIALGAMTEIQSRGLTPGSDIAVAGYDDIPAAQHAIPPLTTLRQPIYQIGEMLAERLIRQINDDPTMRDPLLIQPELIIRASSGGAR
jgi:DNA-binding LacI/PurR family transcriptional regulator